MTTHTVRFVGKKARLVPGAAREIRIEPGINLLADADFNAPGVQNMIRSGALVVSHAPMNGSFTRVQDVRALTDLSESEAIRACMCARPDQLARWSDPRPAVATALKNRRDMYRPHGDI